MEQDFHENFQVSGTWFPAFFYSVTELCSFWYGLKDLFALHKLATKLSLTIKNDDITSCRKDVDLHRQLWVAQGRMAMVNVKKSYLFINIANVNSTLMME